MTRFGIEFQLSTSSTSGQNGGLKIQYGRQKFFVVGNLAQTSNKVSNLIDFDLLITTRNGLNPKIQNGRRNRK